MTASNNLNIFKTQRDFTYSAAEIYAAFADRDKLARWWGPEGFTNTFHQFEFKQNGVWQFTMHGPDGNHYPNESYFSELIPAQKIVIRHHCMPFFTLTINLQKKPTAQGCTGIRSLMMPLWQRQSGILLSRLTNRTWTDCSVC